MDDLPLRDCSNDNLISNNSIHQEIVHEPTEDEAIVLNDKETDDVPVVIRPRLSILTEFDPLFKSSTCEQSIIEETFPSDTESSPCKVTPNKHNNDGSFSKLLDITVTNTTQEKISNFIHEQNNSLVSTDNSSKDNIRECTFNENKNPTVAGDLGDTFCLQENNTSLDVLDNNINKNTSTSNKEESEEHIEKETHENDRSINVDDNQTECYAKNFVKSRKSLPISRNNNTFEIRKNPKRHSLPHNIEKNVGIVKPNKMDFSDKLEENSDLKLRLNASQQERATLELEIRQKEEIIIKTQAELIRKEQAYKQEIQQLKQKLEEKSARNGSENINELEETIKTLKAREARLLSEINTLAKEENSFKKIMAEFEMNIQEKVNEIQKLKEEHETVKRHLANLELAFSDVHQKYERSKNIIERYKLNEEALLQRLSASEEMVQKSEEKYDSLKAHAKAQIEKIGKEMANTRESNDMEIHKLQAIIKRLEIKNASLMVSLDQKNKECLALTALCDEVTGKV